MSAPAPRRPLRVLVVGQAPGAPGGIASVQRLHEVALRRRDDVTVTVVVTFDEAGPLRRLRLLVSGLGRAAALLLARRVDVVDMHVSKGLSVLRKGLLVAVARARGVPSVLHAHAGAFGEWFDALPRPARALVVAVLRPDRMVVLSEEAREVYRTRLRLPPARLVVASNPVEWPDRVPDRDPRGPVEAVFLGRLIDRKGVFDLLEGLALLPAPSRARVHATLAGHGDADAVRRRVAELGLVELVDVRTWLGPAERDALLARAQLLVLPSWWEALPMAVLEAMAWAVTPVVTAVGGLGTLVRDGGNGRLVPLKEPAAIARVLDELVGDGEARRRLGAAARADVRGYGADAWAARLVELYRGL